MVGVSVGADVGISVGEKVGTLVGASVGDAVHALQLQSVAPAMYADSTQAQFSNAENPMLVMESGMTMDARLIEL